MKKKNEIKEWIKKLIEEKETYQRAGPCYSIEIQEFINIIIEILNKNIDFLSKIMDSIGGEK